MYNVAAPISRVKLEHIALSIRKFLSCEDELYLPVPEIIELVLPRLNPDYQFLVLTQAELGSNHGMSYPDQSTLALREDVYEGMVAGRGRDRMTAMHELSHLFLHHQGGLGRTMSDYKPQTFRDPEWQAKCLAGAIMMPSTMVALYDTTSEVATVFGVSNDAAHYRRRQLQAS